MSNWFQPLDDAIGAGQDVVYGTGGFLGDVATAPFDLGADILGTAGEGVGDAAGGLFGGLFGGIGNWIFQLAALAVGAWVVVQVM